VSTVHRLEPHELDALVRKTIETNRHATRDARSQKALDQAVEAAYDDGELDLAALLLHCMVARVVGDHHGLLETALDLIAEAETISQRDPNLRSICGAKHETHTPNTEISRRQVPAR
jgi:hypothetical protein